MTKRPQELRRLWTLEEDQKLTDCRHKHPNRPWPGTAKLAELDRTDKSCWERWYNHLKPGVSKETFSQGEDDIISKQVSQNGKRWAFIRDNYLQSRTANDIKNHFNNHLKKKKVIDCRRKHPNRPWRGTAKLAQLDRADKSCWERWNNHLKPGVNEANFSQKEDDTIVRLHRVYENKWETIAENPLLRGRSPNAIKNHWKNHLKKRHAI